MKLAKRTSYQLSVHGINLNEYLVLRVLQQAPAKPAARIELADHLGLSASGITRLIAPMQKVGLVETETNPRDARQSLVKLTDVGERLFEEASVSFEFSCTQLLQACSVDEQTAMQAQYQKLI